MLPIRQARIIAHLSDERCISRSAQLRNKELHLALHTWYSSSKGALWSVLRCTACARADGRAAGGAEDVKAAVEAAQEELGGLDLDEAGVQALYDEAIDMRDRQGVTDIFSYSGNVSAEQCVPLCCTALRRAHVPLLPQQQCCFSCNANALCSSAYLHLD